VRDLRVPRILFYIALAGLGLALSLKTPEHLWAFLSKKEAWLIPLFVVALIFAAVFAIVTNNLEDLPADRISNPNRPLVTGEVNPSHYLIAGVICEAVALLISFLASWEMFAGIATISIGYFIYSCKPLRLKRIPVLSKFIIGVNSLVVAVTGFALTGADWHSFPVAWIIFILVPLSLAANFVDLKDVEGDRQTGVATLPVIMGLNNARYLIAVSTLAVYAMGGILLGIVWVYPLNAVAAMIHIWLLFRQPYAEKWVFLILLASLFGLDVFLFFA
jgi:4-hydroxybenzoate polyprenyltransferase